MLAITYLSEESDEHYEEAVGYLEILAGKGLTEAWDMLGMCYENGLGVEQDYEKAFECYLMAADDGFPAALYMLGTFYENGWGVDQDEEAAQEYFQLAADEGYDEVLYSIACMYFYGDGADVDYEAAAEYLTDAYELGNAEAMFLLGMCYEEGYGLDQDLEMAAQLYQEALDAGYEPDEEDAEILNAILGEVVEAAMAEDESAGAEEIETHVLSAAIISAIIEAVENVDMEAMGGIIGHEFSEDGTVFSLLEDVLTDINERRSEAEKEVPESLALSIGILASLGEEELSEEDLDALFGLMLLELVAGEEESESDEDSLLTDLAAADLFINFILDTAESNEVIAEAVEATDSSLFEILEQTLAVLGEYADEDGTMYVFNETEDNYFDEFEAELDKVGDYINTMEGPKQAAFDVLALIRVINDEVQSAIYSQIQGESAEAVTTKTFRLGTSSYTLEIPESFEEGEKSEEDVKNYMVAYMKSSRFKTDFDVYQFGKEGLPETVAELATEEAKLYNTTDIQTDVEVNGITVARCVAIEPYQGKDYNTITYYLDDGDTYVEIVFWLWDDASEEQAEAIFSTLSSAKN